MTTAMRALSYIKGNLWLMNLVFIAFGSYFVAGTINSVLAGAIREVPSSQQSNPSRRGRIMPAKRSADYASIAERNLFAAKRETLGPVDTTTTSEAVADALVSGTEYDPTKLAPCSVPIALRGTLVADGAPEWSMALVYQNGERETEVFTINEGSNQLADDAVLVDVLEREIVVRRRDHFELCTAEGETSSATLASVTEPEARDEEQGVSRVSDTEYKVDRAERDRVFNNLSEVATQARIVPSFKNGKPNGFKLFSIKPGSIFSKIGLQNGDVIQKINGYEINSPDKALELYQKLRDTSDISVDLLRRGQSKSLGIEVEP